jgi:hypothetical protein
MNENTNEVLFGSKEFPRSNVIGNAAVRHQVRVVPYAGNEQTAQEYYEVPEPDSFMANLPA